MQLLPPRDREEKKALVHRNVDGMQRVPRLFRWRDRKGIEGMNKLTEFLVAFMIIGVLAWIFVPLKERNRPSSGDEVCPVLNETYRHNSYANGVNDALNCITLLALEQSIDNTNRTWGAMSDIVRTRLHVEKQSSKEGE
jgi:hypothetical protein